MENTNTDEKRLKFLYAWLTKHQRRMISYSDEFFSNVSKVLSGYLFSPENDEIFETKRELYQEVCTRFAYIKQARRVRILEDTCSRFSRGGRITYRQMMREAVDILNELKFEIVNFFPALVEDIIDCVEKVLRDRYLQRTYLDVPESSLSKAGLEIRKNYGRLVNLQDSFKAVQKVRLAAEGSFAPEAATA